MEEENFKEAVELLHKLLEMQSQELAETRSLLHDVVALLKEEKAQHARDLAEIRSSCVSLFKHHDEEMSETHKLLRSSEDRIGSTNSMIQNLSNSCNTLVEVNKDLKDSYLLQFERASSQNKHLMEENARLLKENEAYYIALKNERARYDQAMASMISFLCGGGHGMQPVVNIDQKPK